MYQQEILIHEKTKEKLIDLTKYTCTCTYIMCVWTVYVCLLVPVTPHPGVHVCTNSYECMYIHLCMYVCTWMNVCHVCMSCMYVNVCMYHVCM